MYPVVCYSAWGILGFGFSRRGDYWGAEPGSNESGRCCLGVSVVGVSLGHRSMRGRCRVCDQRTVPT